MQFPALAQYTLFGYERFSGSIDIAALQQALLQSARRADVFALRIEEEDGELYQRVDATFAPTVDVVDLRGEADAERALQGWLQTAFHTAYALAGAPLMELFLLRMPEAVIAYVRGHHAVCDAWGLRLFLESVRGEYLRIATPEALAGC